MTKQTIQENLYYKFAGKLTHYSEDTTVDQSEHFQTAADTSNVQYGQFYKQITTTIELPLLQQLIQQDCIV